MAASLEKISENTAQFNIEVEASEFEKGVEKAFLKNAKNFHLPGFRKGKAPRRIIERYYGEGVFYEDAINLLFPDVYGKAVDELGLEPVDRPDLDVVSVGGGENLVLKVTVTVKPEVTLGKYKGIEIKKVEYNVSDEEVEEELKRYQERNSRVSPAPDRPVEDGDIVTIDFKGLKDGVPFPGGEGNEYELTIGSGQFIPGFEEQLIGKNAGDDVNVNVTFPEDYHAEDLKGAAVLFEVKIHSVKVKELPALDDELAKDVSEFDTLDEFKADIRAKLTEQAETKQKTEMENAAVDAVAETVTVDIPACMVESQIETMLRDYNYRLAQQGLSLEKYLELTGMQLEDMKAQFKDQAAKQVKTMLILETIAKAEEISVSGEELEAEYAAMAERYKMPLEDVKKYAAAEDLSADLKIRKTVKLLVANASLI